MAEDEKYQFNFSDYIVKIIRFRWAILTVLFFSTLIAFHVERQKEELYQASATLILIPPKYSTELRPSQMSIELYMKFATMPQILQCISERAPALTQDMARATLRPTLEPVEGNNNTLLLLSVLHPDNVKAQQIANVWVDVFLDEVDKLRYTGQSGSFEFINKEVGEIYKRLLELEKEKRDLELAYPLDILKGKRDILQRQLLNHIDLLNQKRDELAMLEGSVDKAAVERMKKNMVQDEVSEEIKMVSNQISLFSDKISRMQLQIFDHRIDRQQAEIELKECEKQLKQESMYFNDKKGDLNPVYLELLQKISGQKLRIASYENMRKQLEQEMDSLRSTMGERLKERRENSAVMVMAEYISKEKEIANYQSLVENGGVELKKINEDVSVVENKLKEVTRSLDLVNRSFSELSNKSESTRLAKAENYSDFKVLSRATIPTEKNRKQYGRIILTYDLVAFLVFMLIVLLAEFVSPDFGSLKALLFKEAKKS